MLDTLLNTNLPIYPVLGPAIVNALAVTSHTGVQYLVQGHFHVPTAGVTDRAIGHGCRK